MPRSTTITSQALKFPNLDELCDNVGAVRAVSGGSREPVTVSVAGFCYKVDFQKHTVTESFWQRLRRCLDHCRGRKHPTTYEVRQQLFKSHHFTSPQVAFWVLANQAEKARAIALLEGHSPDIIPAITHRGSAPQLDHIDLTAYSTLGVGTCGVVEQTMAGNVAGPLWVMKCPRSLGMERFFTSEVALLRQLEHPNIVRCQPALHHGRELVMEDGGVSMYSLCTQPGMGLSKEKFLRLLEQLLMGLVYLHQQNIVHRDIKVDNILVSAQTGHLQITDFGLAAQLGSTGYCPPMVGAGSYMAPEMILGQAHGRGVDMYGAGFTLYTMCSGGFLNFDAGFNGEQGIISTQTVSWLVERAVNGLPQFTGREKQQMRLLMESMLRRDPETRITAEEALSFVRTVLMGKTTETSNAQHSSSL